LKTAKRKILVIEDDEIIRENLVSLLELHNYEVKSAENGKTGLDNAFTFKPDLIICDVMMPDISGFEVLEILSSDNEFRKVVFLFLTALTDNDNFRNGMNLGADDYINKPFDSENLLLVIKNRLDKFDFLRSVNHKVPSDKPNSDKLNKLLIRFGNKSFPLDIEKIVYLNADRQYTSIFTITPKKYVIKKSLKEWEAILPNANFIRIHRSFIININHVTKIEKDRSNHYSVKFNGFENIVVSRRFYKNLKKLKI